MKMPSRWFDFGCAITISLLFAGIMVVVGDWMYVGWYYYLIVPLGFCIFATICRVKPLFLSGTASIMVVLFVPYILINLSKYTDEFTGLGHFVSLPGAAIGLIIAIIITWRSQNPIKLFFSPVIWIGLGFFINQMIVCNTLMWCGPFLSFCGR